MNPTGSSEHKANGGMETAIVVVNGVDGLTPDMLRVRPDAQESVIVTYTNYVWNAPEPDKFELARDFTEAFKDPE